MRLIRSKPKSWEAMAVTALGIWCIEVNAASVKEKVLGPVVAVERRIKIDADECVKNIDLDIPVSPLHPNWHSCYVHLGTKNTGGDHQVEVALSPNTYKLEGDVSCKDGSIRKATVGFYVERDSYSFHIYPAGGFSIGCELSDPAGSLRTLISAWITKALPPTHEIKVYLHKKN